MIRCPNCGQSHYAQHYSTTTAMGWTQTYKNGVPQHDNPNISTTFCTCCECNHNFYYKEQYGEIIEVIDQGVRPEIPVIEMPTIDTPVAKTTNFTTKDYLIKSETPSNHIDIPMEIDIQKLQAQIDEIKKTLDKLIIEVHKIKRKHLLW